MTVYGFDDAKNKVEVPFLGQFNYEFGRGIVLDFPNNLRIMIDSPIFTLQEDLPVGGYVSDVWRGANFKDMDKVKAFVTTNNKWGKGTVYPDIYLVQESGEKYICIRYHNVGEVTLPAGTEINSNILAIGEI